MSKDRFNGSLPNRTAERKRACDAYDAMAAARPLRPPPTRPAEGAPRRIGEVELAREIRSGHYKPARPLFQGEE